MKTALAILMAITIAACAGVQHRSAGNISIPNTTASAAFDIALAATQASGMTVSSTDKNSGLIVAIAPAPRLLTYRDPVLNIIVRQTGANATIAITSTTRGQMFDYGVSSGSIAKFCSSIQQSAPAATCT